MRTIGEIQLAVHEALSEGSVDAISGLSTAELCLCVESLVVLKETLRAALEGLRSAIYLSEEDLGLEEAADLAGDVCDQVDEALEVTPKGWLDGDWHVEGLR